MGNTAQKEMRLSVSSQRRHWPAIFILLLILLFLCFFLSLAFGSVSIPLSDVWQIITSNSATREAWRIIVLDFRLPKALTAVLAGAALSTSGLLMQTLFRNPLADPYILGISSGASLGVAVAVLSTGTFGTTLLFSGASLLSGLGVVAAASIGAAAMFGLIMLVSYNTKHIITLLVLGLMIGYMTGAVVSILVYFSIAERVQAYLNWTFGSFGGVTWDQMRVLGPVVMIGLIITQLLAKTLNAMLLGENYARSLGLNIEQAQLWIIGGTSLLAGTITAFCGPIAFMGIAVPHLARNLLNTSNHHVLLPAVTLIGSILALIFDLIAQMPGQSIILPLNAVTALIGAPIVIWIILGRRSGKSSFTETS